LNATRYKKPGVRGDPLPPQLTARKNKRLELENGPFQGFTISSRQPNFPPRPVFQGIIDRYSQLVHLVGYVSPQIPVLPQLLSREPTLFTWHVRKEINGNELRETDILYRNWIHCELSSY
jgi:hypothetical protein